MTSATKLDEWEALAVAIVAIHRARVSHGILSLIATEADSEMLARAALEGLDSAGFKIVKNEGG